MINNNYLSYIVMLKKLKNRNNILENLISSIIENNSENLHKFLNQYNHIKKVSLKKMNNNLKNNLSCLKQSAINDKVISINTYLKYLNKLSKHNPPKKSKFHYNYFSKDMLNKLSMFELVHIIADINKYQFDKIINKLIEIDTKLINSHGKNKRNKIIFNDNIDNLLNLKKEEMINYILNNSMQKGAGYYIDLESTVVGGLPVVKGYIERNPPVFVDKLIDQSGSGFYYDFGKGALAGRPVTKGYDDHNPPLFIGDLVPKVTAQDRKMIGGSNIDQKIEHLKNYIQDADYSKLPNYVKYDLHNFQ